jgi:hypothetical protein
MVLSFEQLLIDVEVFRMCKRARQGIATDEERWLEEVIRVIGPAGNFLSEESTVQGVRGGSGASANLARTTPLRAGSPPRGPGCLRKHARRWRRF